MKNSVTEKGVFLVTPDEAGARLDRWFQKKYPDVTHSFIHKLLRRGKIKINGKKAKANVRLEEGYSVEVFPFVNVEKPKTTGIKNENAKISDKDIEKFKTSIIFMDDHVIVINKEPGLATQGGTGIKNSVDAMLVFLKMGKEEKPKLVHRIDKDTSGILILARSTKVAQELTAQFKNKEIEKTYLALVVGTPEIKKGKISLPISAKKKDGKLERAVIDEEDGVSATTYYKVIDDAKVAAFLKLMPITGRMHQLRVHMSHIGHPIVGDGKYGAKAAFIEEVSDKMHLHAYRAEFRLFNKNYDVSAPLPPHILESLKFFALETPK